ncbi:FAD/FMN-containing dehydrogenase [Penicillium waksmanii]|uniref:FAD/FMN-containing dehydrogenase n=1 Tax=Penicillium waksmanii TaxID=69791 RepID=UPI0025490958|nr:FAD/FMN-containing dehydrogenase [Penicillium waksmanii]KAJ5975466.1 FAD/FMN-containing dehydrogenase [Penicillium waksmanii]
MIKPHGIDPQKSSVADFLPVTITIVDITTGSDGSSSVLTEETTPKLLMAFRIGLGVWGIVVEVTLQAEPLTFLKRTTKVVEVPDDSTVILILKLNCHWFTGRKPTTKEQQTAQWTSVPKIVVAVIVILYYDHKNYAIATPPSGICYRAFMGQFERFFPMENLAEAGKDYFNYAQSQADRMKPYHTVDPVNDDMKGYLSDDVTVITRFVKGDDNWLSPVNKQNLPANSSGIFATLEYSWIPSYKNYTLQWFYQDVVKQFIPTFGEKHNVRPHWNKMIFNNETYASTIYPKINSWLDIQEKMDPACQIVNNFLVESLGIDRCKSLF